MSNRISVQFPSGNPVQSASPWWAPVPSAPPWYSALLALPRFLVLALPRGHGPPPCHESGSWASVHSPSEVALPSYWLLHHTDCSFILDCISHNPLHWSPNCHNHTLHWSHSYPQSHTHLRAITHTIQKTFISFHRSPSVVLRVALSQC